MDWGQHLVDWEQVCIPKQRGGLGIRRMDLMNKDLLCKHLWRFELEDDSIWRSHCGFEI